MPLPTWVAAMQKDRVPRESRCRRQTDAQTQLAVPDFSDKRVPGPQMLAHHALPNGVEESLADPRRSGRRARVHIAGYKDCPDALVWPAVRPGLEQPSSREWPFGHL